MNKESEMVDGRTPIRPYVNPSWIASKREIALKVLRPVAWLMLGMVVDCTSREVEQWRDQAAAAKSATDLSHADLATEYLKRKFPASPISALPARPDVPGLLPIQGGPVGTDSWFDPTRRYLIVGLVVNLENPNQVIAPGQFGGGK